MDDKEMFYSGEYGWVVHDHRIRVIAVWYYNTVKRQCIYKKYEQRVVDGAYLLVGEERGFTDDFNNLKNQREHGSLEPLFDQGIPVALYRISKRV